MAPEVPTHEPEARQDSRTPSIKPTEAAAPKSHIWEAGAGHSGNLSDLLIGEHGPRAGTSIAIFCLFYTIFIYFFGTIIAVAVDSIFHMKLSGGSATEAALGEAPWAAALVASAGVLALIERRRITDFNLNGPRGATLFFGGLAAGFLSVTALIGTMYAGGWLRMGHTALSGGHLFRLAAAWGVAFLLVALTEEGSFRCYLQFTLARGINFWWALAMVTGLCLYLAATSAGHGPWGVYAFALAGVLPCLWLQMSKTPRSRFWQAAWVTSTGFGFLHTANDGETWIGIFAAAAIGFVFCVSVRVTGSAWWALGCHASWDWAETYFYGTADSGYVAHGHYLSTVPVGNPLWSGGADGPEGSLLVLPVILLMLLALLALYGRRSAAVGVAGLPEDALAGQPSPRTRSSR